MDFSAFSDPALFSHLVSLLALEKKTLGEIVSAIKEVDHRRLYLSYGCDSLFQFLTEKLGYTAGSAQRRIDAARQLRALPELKSDLESGALNLMQVSAMARAVREREKTKSVSVSEKREILCAIKNQDVLTSELTIAQMLDIPLKTKETKRIQKDESVRMEITLSKEQAALFEEVKSLMSHSHPNPSAVEVMEYAFRFLIKKKTFAKPKANPKKPAKPTNERPKVSPVRSQTPGHPRRALLPVGNKRKNLWLKVPTAI